MLRCLDEGADRLAQVCWGVGVGVGWGAYLVEAVHCRPPLAVRVQYFPAAVRKAHFRFSRQISTWNTSWSLSSS